MTLTATSNREIKVRESKSMKQKGKRKWRSHIEDRRWRTKYERIKVYWTIMILPNLFFCSNISSSVLWGLLEAKGDTCISGSLGITEDKGKQ